MLSKKQDDVASAIRKNITINIDKKTVITISTEAQDPLICKTIADSVKSVFRYISQTTEPAKLV